jgi:hypothetical protein
VYIDFVYKRRKRQQKTLRRITTVERLYSFILLVERIDLSGVLRLDKISFFSLMWRVFIGFNALHMPHSLV